MPDFQGPVACLKCFSTVYHLRCNPLLQHFVMLWCFRVAFESLGSFSYSALLLFLVLLFRCNPFEWHFVMCWCFRVVFESLDSVSFSVLVLFLCCSLLPAPLSIVAAFCDVEGYQISRVTELREASELSHGANESIVLRCRTPSLTSIAKYTTCTCRCHSCTRCTSLAFHAELK
jgi:hypothetical protein